MDGATAARPAAARNTEAATTGMVDMLKIMQDMQKQMHALQQEIAAMKRSDYSQDSEVEAEHSVTR
eukprot:12407397-Karenia_brevis.AAC.1